MLNVGDQNIQLITDNNLCISCGACKHACPYQVIQIEMNDDKGFYEPIVVDDQHCATCESRACLTVCPSYEENFVELANWTDPAQEIGPWHSIYTGHTNDADVRRRASSGGIIKELCRYFLETGQVDGVITLRHISGLEYEPDIYRTVEDVLQTPGSIYHNISFEQAITILKTTPGNFLLIAIPCQLTSIHKWMSLYGDQMVGQIALTIGLICGWMFTRHSLRHFGRSQGIRFEDLQDATYRGGDKFGALVLDTGEQKHAFKRRPNFFRDKHAVPYWIAFSRTYNSQRCLLCVEHLNYLADIVVGDAWLDAFKNESVGTSIIVVRNPKFTPVFQTLIDSGRLDLQPATEKDVIDSQSRDLALGISAQKIANQMRAHGEFAPTYVLPNPASGLPSRRIWRRNYINPRIFRFFTWRGYGYFWFVCRRLYRRVEYIAYLPLKAGRLFPKRQG